MGPLSGTEILIILMVGLIVIGPENLPKAAAQLGRFVRQAKEFTNQAKERVKAELGPDINDLDLKSLDPRQYDPRRIVRDALRDDHAPIAVPPAIRQAPGAPPASASPLPATPMSMAGGSSRANPYQFVPGAPAPFDSEAT